MQSLQANRRVRRFLATQVSLGLVLCFGMITAGTATAKVPTSGSLNRYFAYDKVEDSDGVIAPWYKGQNGQLDFRLRVAAETLKRYPWYAGNDVVGPAPEFVYMGHWAIDSDGKITVAAPERLWHNGDLAQRASIVINALTRYYAYSGDPACFGLVHTVADHLTSHCATSEYPRWPNVLVSVPVNGAYYGKCDRKGYIQLDITAEAALALVTAYQFAGKKEWLDYAVHLADLFATNADLNRAACPWPRYANPDVVKWGKEPDGNVMTGSVVYVLRLFEQLMRMGYHGENNSYSKARDAGLAISNDSSTNPGSGILPLATITGTTSRPSRIITS